MVALNTQHQNPRNAGGKRRGMTFLFIVVLMCIALLLAFFMRSACGCGSGEKARQKSALQDISNIKTAMDTFKTENGRYPTTAEGIEALVSNPGQFTTWTKLFDRLPLDPWGRQYIYRAPGSHGEPYELYCTGTSGQDGNSDNIRLP